MAIDPFIITVTLFFFFFLSPVAARIPRRALHEPLFPIQWTPPPPAGSDPNPFPQTPSPPAPFFSDGPPSSTPSGNIQTQPQSQPKPKRSSSAKPIILAVSLSVASLALLSLFLGFFIYRRRLKKSQPDTRKLIGGNGNDNDSRFRRSSTPDFLYLGTMEPAATSEQRRRVSDESSSSPYRKLSSERERVVEMNNSRHHPSPELQPLPPLIGPDSIKRSGPIRAAAAAAASSDDDGFYTPNMSVNSLTSESPGSPLSRRSSSLVDHNPIPPKSRRTSPRMQIPKSPPPHIKHAIQPPPPPPPPPPPLPPKSQKSTGLPPPLPPLPPKLTEDSTSTMRTQDPPSSRRQLLRPLPAEAVRIDMPMPFPPSRLSNISGSGLLQMVDDAEENEGDERPKLKQLHWDKVRACSDRAMVWDQLKSSSFQ